MSNYDEQPPDLGNAPHTTDGSVAHPPPLLPPFFEFDPRQQRSDFQQAEHGQHSNDHHTQHQNNFQDSQNQDNFQQMHYLNSLYNVQHENDVQNAQDLDGYRFDQHEDALQHTQPEDTQQSHYLGTQGPPMVAGVLATQLPPLDLRNTYFEDTRSAKTFLQQPIWRPKSENYGIPRSMDERVRYVKRIYDAIIDLSDVQDADLWPAEAAKFQAGTGMWAHPQDIEAISHEVVEMAIKIHRTGVLGLRFLRDDGLRIFAPFDAILAFPERIYFMAYMLRHFKFKADAVMRNCFLEEYLARVWSELMDQPAFRQTWGTLNAEEQLAQLDRHAYSDVPQKPPTKKQRAGWLRRYEMDASDVQQQQEEQEEGQQQQFQEQPVEGMEGSTLPPRKRRNTGGSS